MIKSYIFPSKLPQLLFLLSIFFSSNFANAQGGPPMLTDDSDVPGNGNWENNFAVSFEGSKDQYQLSFPALDLNYGLGDRIQLKVELPWVKENGTALANKFDHITLGLKYQFLDEDSDGVSFSFYPQPIISFNPEDHSKKNEFGIFLPVAASKQFFHTGMNIQIGYQVLGTQKQWVFGLVMDHAIGEYLLVLAELHSTIGREAVAGANSEEEVFFRAGTFLNIGLQIKPSKKYFINFAFGKDIESNHDLSDGAKYYGYAGLQLNL